MIGISTFPYIRMSLQDALGQVEPLTPLVEVLSESRHDILRYGEVLSSFNLTYTIHAPITDMNFSSIHAPLRQAALSVLEDVVKCGVEVGAETFVAHPGYIGWSDDYASAKIAMSGSLVEISRLAKEYGVLITIENQPNSDYLLFKTPDVLSELDGLGFTLDVGHANTVGMLDEFLTCDINHIHLHDNNGGTDEHLAIGEGTIEFREVARATKDDEITKILELRRSEDIEPSLNRLRELYGE
jgi:sugar phosphate isomerase/epimerase